MASNQTPRELVKRFAPLPPAHVKNLVAGFTQDALKMAENFLPSNVWFSVADNDALTLDALPASANVIKQSHDDHASRLITISEALFARSYRSVLMVAMDCPSIDITYVRMACNALNGCDAVLGPSTNGGYMVVGLTKSIPRLFLEIDMGTPHVLRQTLLRARELDLKMNILPGRFGADTLQDIEDAAASGELVHATNTLAVLGGVRSSNS